MLAYLSSSCCEKFVGISLTVKSVTVGILSSILAVCFARMVNGFGEEIFAFAMAKIKFSVGSYPIFSRALLRIARIKSRNGSLPTLQTSRIRLGKSSETILGSIFLAIARKSPIPSLKFSGSSPIFAILGKVSFFEMSLGTELLSLAGRKISFFSAKLSLKAKSSPILKATLPATSLASVTEKSQNGNVEFPQRSRFVFLR